MEWMIAKSSLIYRVYATIIDFIVAFVLINLMGLINSLLLITLLNAVKIVTYYIYHRIFIHNRKKFFE
jgi:uncharacterized membrane protein